NFLTRDDLISKEQEGLASRVPPGMRGITVRVTAETGVGGFLLPNSRADILWTGRAGNDAVTQTILQDVLVLAIDTQSARNPDNPQAIVGATATFALKPEDVQTLTAAANSGEIR